jgi:hypothetical protein
MNVTRGTTRHDTTITSAMMAACKSPLASHVARARGSGGRVF